MIAAAAVAVALLLTRSWDWPRKGWARVTMTATLFSLGYMVFSDG